MFVVTIRFQEQLAMLWGAVVQAGFSQALGCISAAALHCVTGCAEWPLLCPF